MKLNNHIIQAVFPQKCICCGGLVHFGEYICNRCNISIERFPTDRRCLKCGQEIKNCVCKNRVFHFISIISPFYNTGIAQRAFYKYKFSDRKTYSVFFAQQMLNIIKEEYKYVEIDAVCCVPPSKRRIRRYGFNSPELLARYIADGLKIPFLEDVLTCEKRVKAQHRLSIKERFSAIKGKYAVKNKTPYKSILLVDDIFTTGATLDECARLCLLAGAQEVRCITALITPRRPVGISDYSAEVLRRAGVDKKVIDDMKCKATHKKTK